LVGISFHQFTGIQFLWEQELDSWLLLFTEVGRQLERQVADLQEVLKSREENAPPTVQVSSQFSHGTWVVVFTRPLVVDGDYRKAIVPGKTYSFGVAIHESHAAKRYHHVSFDHTFVLDSGDADVVAPSR